MAISKVVYGDNGEVLIDLTADTITKDKLLKGYTAHGADGEVIEGAEVTIGMAKAEGWYSKKDKYGKETSKWQTMPELMLAYRAAAFFARAALTSTDSDASDRMLPTTGTMVEMATFAAFSAAASVVPLTTPVTDK